MDIVLVRLAYPSKEVDRVRIAHVPVERLEDVAFSLEDLDLRVRRVGTVEEVRGAGGNDLFDLGSDEHAGDPDELELGEGDDALGEEAVDDVDAEEQRLGQQAEAGVYLDEPVDEDASHLPCEILLHLHGGGVRHGGELPAR